ncbi:MAG: TonB-dependent receptor [Flavobacteriales bacterium]|nr:TonB-dependent receptor [Flavobacteriales bacterium]
MKYVFILIVCLLAFYDSSTGQTGSIRGSVYSENVPLPFVNVLIKGSTIGSTTNENGAFIIENLDVGSYTLVISYLSYQTKEVPVKVSAKESNSLKIELERSAALLGEVVISSSLKPMSKKESAVPVDVYTPKFFKSNPTPSVYEAMQTVNGVRPQINCAVCNTGDIHINGLEGPYTMVLIDGMPIVSGLSTVYGLSGIPQSLIERVEIVKGPASTLYGSEAVGGLINVITKKPNNAAIFSGDVFGTSWGEVNTDLATKLKVGKKATALFGVNYFKFDQIIDNNDDNFTDLALQDRVSVFNKWNFQRKDNKIFSLAVRYVYEDRWGGELDWEPKYRGGTEKYGESIYTNRWELFGTYQLPVKERMLLSFSVNRHDQNSVYGDTWYIADQRIGFGQLTWNKDLGERHDLLLGTAVRYTYYDDNTPATASADSLNIENAPSHTYLPGIFIQDDIKFNQQNKLLLGMRYDYNTVHGNIFTPRINYKWTSKNEKNTLRVGFGTGYRVANVFTEDHAALTGAREVVFLEDLNPETSWNGNINYVKNIYSKNDWILNIDASVFYTYFNNAIFPDYDTDPNKIIYSNLAGYAVSNGVALNLDFSYDQWKMIIGGTLMEVYTMEDEEKSVQPLTENFTGTWTIGYTFPGTDLNIDYTGNLYSPMVLPVLGPEDPRPEKSSWFSIQNLQITKPVGKFELYGGVKNLLNWTPWKNLDEPIIARAFDPFDQNVQFDADGNAIASEGNPNALTFDPSYIYAPNQGIRGFLGIRFAIQ